MRFLYFMLSACLLTGVFSCNKKKWKLPVDLTFHAGIISSTAHGGKLLFEGGNIVITEFEFDGKRIQGDDVFFRKEFNELSIPLDPAQSIAALDFEIPQGTYTKIEIRFKVNSNSVPGMEINGAYTNHEGEKYPLKLQVKNDEYYALIAHDSTGSNEIILDKDIPSNSTLLFNPAYWFQTVSDSLLDEAEVSDESGNPVILINEDENEHIFNVIQNRLDDATEVLFY